VTYGLAQDSLPEEFKFLDLGEHTLKDIRRAERVYQLISPGLPAEFPPLRTSNRLLHNLPTILTSFVGREKELLEISDLISCQRLITIVGSGGVGKTRLAVQAATTVLEQFPDGGWFVDLTSISNPTLVTQFLMTTLGIYEDGCCDSTERLKYYFQDRKMLLILDNCEHILPGVAPLVQLLLGATEQLTILATSRESLGVVGETVWCIPLLSTPGIDEEVSLEALMVYEAVALFVERAAATSGFVLTRENAQLVAQICARLEGIPLALELAAARTKILTIADMSTRLDNQFGLLVSNQNVPYRQKTLRNLIDWSYDLLPEQERILFRRLSIFSGSWALEAAEAICADTNLRSLEVLDLLSHLVDRSLVIADTMDGSKRYRLLETIRQYGYERLSEAQETDLFALKHATYFTNLSEQSAAKLWGDDQGIWLRRLDMEHDNLRAALEWLFLKQDQAKMMLRLSSALWRFWRIRGYYQEGRMHLDRALAQSPMGSKELRAEALRGAAVLALQQGDYGQATASIEKCLALFTELENQRGVGHALDVLGEVAYYQGDYARSAALHNQSLRIRIELDDKEGQANSLRHLGMISRDQGDFQVAREDLSQSLEIGRKITDRILVAKILDNLGLVEHYLCNYDRADELFAEAVSIYRELDDRLGISNTLQNQGNVAKDRGDFKQAKVVYNECLALKRTFGDKRGIAQALASLAELAFYQGKYIDAADLAGQSLALFQDLGVKRGVIFTLGLLAYIAEYNGEFERASGLAQECLQLATELNAPRPLAYCKELFGLIAYAQENLAEARQLFEDAIEIFERVGDRRNVASARINLARTSYRQGEIETALQYVNDSLAVSRELNIRWILSVGLEILGLLERSQNRDASALTLFQESLKLSLEQDNQQGIANCLGAIAGLAVIADMAGKAVPLFSAAQKIRQEIGAAMGRGDQKEYDSFLELARRQLTEEEFISAWGYGQELTLAEVVELANIEMPPNNLEPLGRIEVINEA
jgi:predicted ATPase